MLKLKLQHFGHLMQRADSFENTLMLGKIEGGRRRGWQRMRWLDGITNSITWVWGNSGNWWWTGKPGMLQSMVSQSWTQLSDWTELNKPSIIAVSLAFHPYLLSDASHLPLSYSIRARNPCCFHIFVHIFFLCLDDIYPFSTRVILSDTTSSILYLFFPQFFLSSLPDWNACQVLWVVS